MMGVDLDIALGAHIQVEQAMAAKRIEHVIEKRHPRIDGGFARSIDVERKRDVGFLRGAGKFRGTLLGHG